MRERARSGVLLAAAFLLPCSSHAEAEEPDGTDADKFGFRVVSIGDVDGDSVPDLAVSAPYAPGGGRVFFFSGKDGKPIRSLGADSAVQRLGHSLASIGDIDGDGKPDVLAGAALADRGSSSRLGTVIAFSGSSGKVIREYPQAIPNTGFGDSVADFGDFDGDGLHDFLVSLPYDSPGGTRSAGAVNLLSSKTGLPLLRMEGREPRENLGLSMAPAGDVDGDGTPDIAATGMVQEDDTPIPTIVPKLVRVHSGKAKKTVLTIKGLEGLNVFGLPIAAPGDLDGDGKGDLVVGSPFQQKGNLGPFGMVRAFSGASGKEIWSVFGARVNDFYGFAVVDPGDVDGDRVRDVAVAAGLDPDLALMAKWSRVEILSGRNGALLRDIRLPDAGEFLMVDQSLAVVGDLDADGRPEIAATTATVSGSGAQSCRLRVRVFSGKDGKLVRTLTRPPEERKPTPPPK